MNDIEKIIAIINSNQSGLPLCVKKVCKQQYFMDAAMHFLF